MTLPTLRAEARAVQLTAIVAAHPLQSGRLLRAMALAAAVVPGAGRTARAGG